MNGDVTAYRDEVKTLSKWCNDSKLCLNISKTKEMIMDFRRKLVDSHACLHIDGAAMGSVRSTKFLGVHLSDDLSWSLHVTSIVKSARQRLYFLQRLKREEILQMHH